jgi:hypothetical protein
MPLRVDVLGGCLKPKVVGIRVLRRHLNRRHNNLTPGREQRLCLLKQWVDLFTRQSFVGYEQDAVVQDRAKIRQVREQRRDKREVRSGQWDGD